ncbi:MAG: hypothetical protein ACXABD_12585 [Candidatus Thorarchaeota archaeon]|jgi:hypothetical protein
MKPEKFVEYDKHFMGQVDMVLHGKGQHYTEGEDRYSNFREAASLGGTEPVDEMLAQMRKHVVGFFTMFRKAKTLEGYKVSSAKLLEHGGDVINFIRLIYAWQLGEEPTYVACNLSDCRCQEGDPCIA